MNKKVLFKVLSTFVAVVLTLQLILTGCGKKDSDVTNSTQTPQTQQTTEPTVDNPTKDFVTVSWYLPKPISNIKDQELVEAEANKIIKEKINANIKFNFVDSASWEDKMKLMSAAGEAYDICFTSSWSNRLDVAVQRGALMPLDELLEKYGPNIKEKVDPRAWKAATYSGKIMAIPSQSPFASPYGFVFKKDLVEKYNFDYKSVKTMADLEPYLETIKKNEPNITPLLATGKQWPAGLVNTAEVGMAKGVAFDEKSGKIMLNMEIPESVAIYRTVNDYYKKGYIAKDAATKTDTNAEAKSGKYAVMPDSGGYTEDGSKSTAMYGFPCVETLYAYPMISTYSMINACSAISATSKNPERAMMLLDLIWSDKVLLNTLAYGVEGKDYIITAGKGTDTPTVKANSGAEQTWAIWHNTLGPLWDQWDSNWNSTKALQAMKENNEKAKAATPLGFIFDSTNVKNEITQVGAVMTEANPILFTGCMPDFDKFIAELIQKQKTAGADKVLAEVQKQYDDWKAKNK